MALLDRILRAGEGRKLQHLRTVVPRVAAHADRLAALDDAGLRAMTGEFRSRVSNGADLDDLMPEAFGVVREAAWRVSGQRHFDVQVMGGAALHLGWVAEMRTGEGKTLTATLPVYLNALAGKGVHVITVNEYLAARDSTVMGRIYGFLGLSTGLVTSSRNVSQDDKRAQYGCDVTYGVNTEMGFDYLRDNMVTDMGARVQRGFAYAVVDEVDSVLIDEARTPLLISTPHTDVVAAPYHVYAEAVSGLTEDEHYEVREDKFTVMLTEAGIEEVESALGVENMFALDNRHVAHYVHAALKARCLYRRDEHYVVLDGRVKIVDEFTGRVMEGRRWSDGIHQAVEAKEGVAIEGEGTTMATVTLQNYFRMYDKLAGMTGTAGTSAAELKAIYGLDVVAIPTNRPNARVDHPERVFHTVGAKWGAVVDEVVRRHRSGQPVLVGTTSVAHSEHLSEMLGERGVAHEVLNAKHLAEEADIVAQAGRPGAVTVATNMAGRGVDILLGGNPEGLVHRMLVREGFAPETFVSERDLGRPVGHLPYEMRVLRTEALARREELTARLAAQCAADAEAVRRVGGLCVVGTERHESRRIDDQLRGRAGRQGDPGESVFFVSMEDEMLALYAFEALEWADEQVEKGALAPDAPIGEGWVHKAVDAAQAAVEQKNYQARKTVLDYDEVLDRQRKVVYARREQIVGGVDLKAMALENVADAVFALAREHLGGDGPWEADAREGFLAALRELWPVRLTPADLAGFTVFDEVDSVVLADAAVFYETIEARMGGGLMRDIERQMMLQVLDRNWREHLTAMEMLQDAVHLRAVANTDPLSEWQRDSYEMFERMMRRSALEFVRFVMHVRMVRDDADILREG